MNTLFLTPLDVLFLRGNQHFGTAGAHGAALMPPWPSLAAGAIRSRLMAAGETLETLADFRLTYFGLAQRIDDKNAEALLPLPSDVMVSDKALNNARYATPTTHATGITSSYALPKLPSFCLDAPAKPISGLWLNAKGIATWLAGSKIAAEHLVRSSELWKIDSRLGIALDAQKRSAADGQIYTSEAVALEQDIGFAVRYEGAPALAENSMIRLGGDGRGAIAQSLAHALPEPDWQRIQREGRFRLLLTTPGLFANGWHPEEIPGQLVAASVNRADTISGWDLLTAKPKAAQRIAPAGSVYWFESSDGKLADVAALKALLHNGLPIDDATRRTEGFNHCHIAAWTQEN